MPSCVPAILRPADPEGEQPARLPRREGADQDPGSRSSSTVPPGAEREADAGPGSATEFPFSGGSSGGIGQPPLKPYGGVSCGTNFHYRGSNP